MKLLMKDWRKFLTESKQLDEAITLDIEVGDIVLGGKFKNKRVEVKEIGKDDLGQPTINGKPLLKFRIEKNLPDNKKSKKTLDAEKSLNEGYYEINPKNPPPIKDVLEDWVDGKKAYDAGSMITGRSIPYHGYYSRKPSIFSIPPFMYFTSFIFFFSILSIDCFFNFLIIFSLNQIKYFIFSKIIRNLYNFIYYIR